jgi:hypothetical protein
MTTVLPEGAKQCTYYGCGFLLPADFKGDRCPHCGHKEYSWEQGEWIKPLPDEAHDLDVKCRKCDVNDLPIGDYLYIKKQPYLTNPSLYHGHEFECRSCKQAWDDEYARQEAMNYIVVQPHEPEEFYETKSEVENMFEEYLSDYVFESSSDNPFEGWVILKVEQMEDTAPTAKQFKNRNLILWNDDWYIVEEIIEPECEYDGDFSVNW